MSHLRLGITTLVPLVASCTLLFGGDEALRCLPGANACPVSQSCQDGRCLSTEAVERENCVPETERCDGRDNDCDSLVDEGQDLDGDGFTWCGGGDATFADCDDGDATVFPRPFAGASNMDACDGRDNNCNGVTDEDAACPAAQVCLGVEGCGAPDCRLPAFACAADSGTICDLTQQPPSCVSGTRCDLNSCAEGQSCDALLGVCVASATLTDGSQCSSDASCALGVCAPSQALDPLAAADARECMQACCRTEDCPDGALCYDVLDGARVCVSGQRLNGTGLGARELGEACSSDAQCASLACDSGQCRRRCGDSSQCATGESCALRPHQDTFARLSRSLSLCVPTSGQPADIPCVATTPCASGLCLAQSLSTAVCRALCASTTGCADNRSCRWIDGSGGSALRACIERFSPPSCDDFGVSCPEGQCIQGVCRPSCCGDTACTGGARCRPTAVANHWEMLCI